MPINEETAYTLGRLLVNRIRANNGGVVPSPVTPAHIKRALSELNRDTSEEMMRMATAEVQRQGVPVSGPVMGESAADVLINGVLRGLPIREGLRLIRRPFSGVLDEDTKGDLDTMRDKLDKLASKQSDPKAKAKLQDIRKELGAAKDIVESRLDEYSIDDYIRDNRAALVAAIKRVEPDAPVQRDREIELWIRNDEGMYGQALAKGVDLDESFREADDARKAAEAMARNAGKKPGDDDWEETVKKFEKHAGDIDKKESRLRESFSGADAMNLEKQFVDKHGINAVLAALSDICYEKAEHVRSSWQDDTLAKQWEKAGNALDSLAAKVRVD